MVTGQQAKNWFKAVLAYVLAIAFVFSGLNTWIQPRTWANIGLTTIILTPARTVGTFLDSTFLLLVAMCIASALFAIIQSCKGSYPAMAIIMFLSVYAFSTLRTINIQRYFAASLVGPLFCIAAVASVVGVSGKNTSNGATFDHNYLISYIEAYLIGVLICLFINLFVFPDFAETHINELLIQITDTLAKLSASITVCISGGESDKDSFIAGTASRTALVAKLQGLFAAIDLTIEQASAEGCKSVSAVLFSMATALTSGGGQRLISSKEFANEISKDWKPTWVHLDEKCQILFENIKRKLCCDRKSKQQEAKEIAELEQALKDSVAAAHAALAHFETHRPVSFLKIFAEKTDVVAGILKPDVIQNWDKFLTAGFFILGSKELVKELSLLHESIMGMAESKKIRWHITHYIPVSFLTKHEVHATQYVPTRAFLVKCKDFLLSAGSIFGFKCAVALFCVNMILFSRPDIYKLWYMSGSVTTILVAISPSMGQTYLGLPIQIIGSSFGAIIGYAAISAVGHTGKGAIGFAAMLAIPFFYLYLFNQKAFVLALLTLMTFSNYVCASNANAINPAFDEPVIYLAKLIAVTAVSLCFSVIFSLLIYPTMARHTLRERLAEIFMELNKFYRKIITSTVNIPEGAIVIEQDVEIKQERNNILSRLFALEQLLAFSGVEPRLEGKFDMASYRAVIECMRRVVDRMEMMRVSGGHKPFDADVRSMLNSGAVGDSRWEMQKTIRLLLYIYASTMLTKKPLPPSLPKAAVARDKLAISFILVLLQHFHEIYPSGNILEGIVPLDEQTFIETLSQEKWMRLLSFSVSAREVSYELDDFQEPMKKIFGEYPDINISPPKEESIILALNSEDLWLKSS